MARFVFQYPVLKCVADLLPRLIRGEMMRFPRLLHATLLLTLMVSACRCDDGKEAPSGDAGMDSGPVVLSCGEGECDFVEQTGCGAEEGCYFLLPQDSDVPEALCEPAGTGVDGDSCTDYGDCAGGHHCLDGVCRQLCCTDGVGMCPSGQRCTVALSGSGVAVCAVPDQCSPLDGEAGCGAGQGCYPISDEGFVMCSSPGALLEGAACTYADSCAPGLVCSDQGNGASCHRACTLGGDDCAAAQICSSLAGFEDFGICTPVTAG